jgi:hypothetical protein
MLAYAGHSVSLLWQSKHACLASARVAGASQVGSPVTRGLVWLRPYGTSWITRNVPRSPRAIRDHHFRFKTFIDTSTDYVNRSD